MPSADVLLVHPRFDRIQTREGMSLHYKKRLPPIDLGYIASILRGRGHRVRLEDAHIHGWHSDHPRWKETAADVVVVCSSSLDTWQCPYPGVQPVIELLARIRSRHVVVYGPQVTEQPELILDGFPHAVCVRGEPEWAVADAVDALTEPTPLDEVPGVSFLRNGRRVDTAVDPRRLLTPLPSPAYDLLPMQKYRFELFPAAASVVEATRGCPHGCGFCLRNMYPQKYRRRPIPQIVDELTTLRDQHGIRHHYFNDLEFNLDPRFVEELLEAVLSRDLDIRFSIQSRCDKLTPRLLGLLKRAGCEVIMFGVESGDPGILAATGKEITLPQIRQAFSMTRDAGIRTLGFFMLGLPGETEATVGKSIAFAEELDPDYASFVIALNYPGTRTHRELAATGWQGLLPRPQLDPRRLEQLRRRAMRSFYLRPRWLSRKLFGVRGPDDVRVLLNGFRGAFLPLLWQPAGGRH